MRLRIEVSSTASSRNLRTVETQFHQNTACILPAKTKILLETHAQTWSGLKQSECGEAASTAGTQSDLTIDGCHR